MYSTRIIYCHNNTASPVGQQVLWVSFCHIMVVTLDLMQCQCNTAWFWTVLFTEHINMGSSSYVGVVCTKVILNLGKMLIASVRCVWFLEEPAWDIGFDFSCLLHVHVYNTGEIEPLVKFNYGQRTHTAAAVVTKPYQTLDIIKIFQKKFKWYRVDNEQV